MPGFRVIAAFLFLAHFCKAQTDKRPEFEVATIKPAAPHERGMFIRTNTGGLVTITNMTLKELVVLAWRVQPYQISGGPSWLDSVHYDISAKAEENFKQTEIGLMIQSLLADRFQLAVHHETKELPIYALVVARKDGKLGPRLTVSKEGGCTTYDSAHPPPPPAPGKPPALGCGGMMMGPRQMRATSIPVAQLTSPLGRFLGRTVLDKTGLTGNYDLVLDFTLDDAQMVQMLPPDAPRPAASDSGPSIFTALQEQLGLKLESQKGPVDVLVIDRVEKPSEN